MENLYLGTLNVGNSVILTQMRGYVPSLVVIVGVWKEDDAFRAEMLRVPNHRSDVIDGIDLHHDDGIGEVEGLVQVRQTAEMTVGQTTLPYGACAIRNLKPRVDVTRENKRSRSLLTRPT